MYFSGRVNSVVYEDPAQAFYILRMVLDSEQTADRFATRSVVVRGHVSGLSPKIGTWFGFEGDWTNHPKYGKQLAISRAPVLENGWDVDTAHRMLEANGVGDLILLSIRNNVGEDRFLEVLGDAEKLQKEANLNAFESQYVSHRWHSTQAYFRTLAFLADIGLPASLVRKVWSHFEDEAEKILSQNPWRLVEIDGISFSQADSIAMKLELDPKHESRIQGAVVYACKAQRSFGHLFLSTGQVLNDVKAHIREADPKDVGKAIAECGKSKSIVVDRKIKEGMIAVYEPWFWYVEDQSAKLLQQRQKRARYHRGGLKTRPYIKALSSVGPKTEKRTKVKRPSLKTVVRTAIQEWGESANLNLSEDQRQGVQNALIEPVSILTGLPGTGKTTSLRAAVQILQDANISFLLCAPTGIAAKNLARLAGAPAYTVHRAFSAKGKSDEKRESTYTGIVGRGEGSLDRTGEGEEWEYGPDNPHPAEVVVVDEASMLDQHLIYRLLTCTSSHCRVVLVGDAAQLPSVGPGNVLRDLISSGQFPVVNLTQIFRQEDTSDIVFAAHDIYRGQMPKHDPPSDFSLVQVSGENQVLEVIKKLAVGLYEKRRNFQILSPRHAGTVGVTNLNAHLRSLLNPAKSGLQEIRLKDDTLREDDRIMVIRNNYKFGVFNGDVGKIARIDRKAKEVELKIFGPVPLFIQIPFQDVPRFIRLAYATTIHKAQGLEYDVIVMPIVDSFRHQLQRNLLYTAVTRAKKKVILVGTASALSTAVRNNREDLRNTALCERLRPGAQSSSSRVKNKD